MTFHGLNQEDIVSVSSFLEALVGSFPFRSSRTPGFEQISVVLHNVLTNFDTLFECSPNVHGQEVMLVRPSQRLP